jgi:DNA-binding response OmpR family regulator
VRDALRDVTVRVDEAANGSTGVEAATTGRPDLVVLDLGLPDIPGEAVARELRIGSAVPILILTARSDEEDRVAGLELGADDYVTKPFSPREVTLPIRAILRRGGDSAAGNGSRSYGGGVVIIDESRRSVRVRGDIVELTPTEWGILRALATSPGRVYSRLELINRVRGHEFDGYERSVDSHIKNLRRKVESDPRHPELVLTVLGGGYRFALDADG